MVLHQARGDQLVIHGQDSLPQLVLLAGWAAGARPRGAGAWAPAAWRSNAVSAWANSRSFRTLFGLSAPFLLLPPLQWREATEPLSDYSPHVSGKPSRSWSRQRGKSSPYDW